MNRLAIYAADVGSIAKNRFGWARTTPDAVAPAHEDQSIERLAAMIADDLRVQVAVCIGFECPLFVPVTQDASRLGKARPGECTPETGNKAFTGSAGACSAMTGLCQLAWLLREIHRSVPEARGTLSWEELCDGTASILVWEAFVSGKAKAKTHCGDAVLAVNAFRAALPNPSARTCVTAETPFSFAGALLAWSGLLGTTNDLGRPAIVIRPDHNAR